MILSVTCAFLVQLCAAVHGLPHLGTKSPGGEASDPESSGYGPDAPVRGRVHVVKVSPHFLRTSALFRRGTALRSGPSRRGAFPAFLSLGRPGLAQSHHGKLASPSALHLGSKAAVDAKRRLGQEMWRKALDKGDRGKEALALPFDPKESSKQSCAAVPFAQRVSAAGCEAVTLQNKLCFGQCSSLYVPPSGEDWSGRGGVRSPCSRCAPSRARSITVQLRCRGVALRERRVLLVQECACETGREEDDVENTRPHLRS